MFTGLVEATGAVSAVTPRGPGVRLAIALQAPLAGEPLALGESIAVDGVCLSVDAIRADGFEIDASAETLARTTLGGLRPGSRVHLERALRAGDRLGGHLVTGHVDGVGWFAEGRTVGDALWVSFGMPAALSRFVAEKGSIAVDGVSLTVNAAHEDTFEVTLIPQTLTKTKLTALKPRDPVNLEVDLIARYVARLVSRAG
jgi:riboflavin synthase